MDENSRSQPQVRFLNHVLYSHTDESDSEDEETDEEYSNDGK
jgi:hypothetical protein